MPLLDCANAGRAAQRAYRHCKKAGVATWGLIRRPFAYLAHTLRGMKGPERIQTGILLVTVALLVLNYRAMIANQRAWVMIDEIKLSEDQLRPGQHTFRAAIRNFGQGPATDVTVESKMLVAKLPIGQSKPVADVFQLPDFDTGVALESATLGPGQVLHVDDLDLPSAIHVDEIPYLVGSIVYRDQFGYDRHTLFCFMRWPIPESRRPDPTDPNTTKVRVQTGPCPRLNRAD